MDPLISAQLFLLTIVVWTLYLEFYHLHETYYYGEQKLVLITLTMLEFNFLNQHKATFLRWKLYFFKIIFSEVDNLENTFTFALKLSFIFSGNIMC